MLQPKKPVKKYVPTAKEKKNLKDAKEQKNMRPPFTSEERKKMPKVGSMGTAKNGKTVKKAKNGKPVKKAAIGAALPLAMKALPMLSGMFGGKGKGAGMGAMGGLLGGLLGGKNGKTIKKSRSGSKMKTCKGGC